MNIVGTNLSEIGSIGEFFDGSSGSPSLSTANYSSQMNWPNGNGRTVSHGPGSTSVFKTLPSQATYYYHAMHRMDGGNIDGLVNLRESTTDHIRIVKNATRNIEIQRGSTTVATSAGSLPNTAPFHLQVAATVADAGGTVSVLVDGAAFVSFSGDTRNGGTGVINNFEYEAGNSNSFVTDIWINDSSGSVNNGLEGALRIWAERMDAEGASGVTATPSAGTDNSDMIDDPTGAHDDDATYIEWSAAGADYYALSATAFSGAAGTIKGAAMAYFARNTDGGGHTGRSGVKKGGSEIDGTTVAWGNTYTRKYDPLSLDPSTSAVWASFAALIAAEWKLETVS